MGNELFNIGLAALEGFALIVSPCILPILPIILSGSLEGNRNRPFGIIIGFVTTFALFTFFAKNIVQYSGIDLSIVRTFSFVVLFFLGLVMISSTLSEQFTKITRGLSNTGSSLSSVNQSGFLSGIFFGGLTGLIWTPCAGPILAAVIVQTVLQKTTLGSFFIILAFGIGTSVPMLIIALGGRKIMSKFNFFKSHTIFIRKILGFIIILSVGLMIYTDSFAISFSSVTPSQSNTGNSLENGISGPYLAPPIANISAWINSTPIQLNQLKGKVILIDFWAYSCINCVRTIPYLNDWYQKYHSKGFEIIGVHSPEFDFERNYNNVKNAVLKYQIKYPVALDNQFTTWQNFRNQYWPAHYLIDKNNNVVYVHFGEGEYDVTENNIRFLLGLNKKSTASEIENVTPYQTPETYLGYFRAENYNGSPSFSKNRIAQYKYVNVLPIDAWELKGKWIVTSEKIISAEAGSAIKIHFQAGQVFAVLGSNTAKPIRVKLLLNGESVINEKGRDVKNSEVIVPSHALYHLLNFKQPGTGILELIADGPGLEAYTFTFG